MTNQSIEVRSQPLGVQDILAQVRLIQEVMGAVMKDKEHYGTIPGCGDKPTLLQPGAQKLLMTFRLAPEYEVFQTDLEKGHREYRVQATLKSIQSGTFVGQGVGCCSTMEGKFRFRVAPKKVTDRPVPKEYWELRGKDPKAAQQLLGGSGFSTKKDENGQWMITEGTSEKVEHDNPADYYNTVLKMAKKRALVDATITATAASDIFTQDIEDMPEVIPQAEERPRARSEQSEAPIQPELVKPSPKPSKAQETASTEPLSEGNGLTLKSVKQIHSKPDAAKPWTLYVGLFALGQDEREISTFDRKLGEQMESLATQVVNITFKPGRKAGTYELVSLVECDDVAF